MVQAQVWRAVGGGRCWWREQGDDSVPETGLAWEPAMRGDDLNAMKEVKYQILRILDSK